MKIEPLPLFSSVRELLVFSLAVAALFLASLGSEYIDYSRLARFEDATVRATVVKQYEKSTKQRRYQVLKLRTEQGAVFYMTAHTSLRQLCGYKVSVRLKTDRLGFFDYLKGFFAHGYIETVAPQREWKYRVADRIASQHADGRIGALFAALFTATPIESKTRTQIGGLGIGHLLAISGFHIGLLSGILFWLLRYPYRFAQSRWFPWRSAKRDLFLMSAALICGYVLFLQMPPSVLRAFAMMLIGFFFYDRGIKVLSFQSLLIAVLLLVALWPRLLFSMGFWLSAAGVFYLFVFLRRFEARSVLFKFIGIHIWVYAMMLPVSLAIFGTFSRLHPFSIVWTMLFILFYPLALLLHLVGEGGLLDGLTRALLQLPAVPVKLEAGYPLLAAWTVLSLLVLPSKTVERLLPYLAAAVFVGAVYQIA
jgi:competence protein ComEC